LDSKDKISSDLLGVCYSRDKIRINLLGASPSSSIGAAAGNHDGVSKKIINLIGLVPFYPSAFVVHRLSIGKVTLLGLGPSRSSSWQLVSDCSGSVSIGSPTQGIINLLANVADISMTLPKR
jgi:hypothetical protein